MTYEQELRHLLAAKRDIEDKIAQLEFDNAGVIDYTVSVNVLEVYFCKARDEQEAMKLYEEGMCGPPDRHIFDIPIVEER